ncbi:DUF5681 domain-containing protein [Nitrobacter sp. JJSN]|uniref:DUF5681 domain-containing protein n=1 Tax=Nitrobacter sp. JJSN TaxID=3453033 RepID=UPI003F75D487
MSRDERPPGKSRRRLKIRPSDDDVGYGKPPRSHQFKPGRSGNPRGRPKGVKSEETILRELLHHKVVLNERGKSRKIILLEAILRKVAEDGLRGNIKSVGFLLNRYYTAATGSSIDAEIGEDDKAVLDAFLKKFETNKDG